MNAGLHGPDDRSRHLDVTGIVLAGGQGRRMGGVDKGWLELDGEPLIARVISRLAPQVASTVISANQNVERYATFAWPVVSDVVADYAGPLAGLHAALQLVTTEYAVTAPCDSPFLPLDLVDRMHAALAGSGNDLAVARSLGRRQPVFCLVRRSATAGLTAFLESGGRKVEKWYEQLAVVDVDFEDAAEAFANINTRDDLDSMAASRRAGQVR